MHTLSSMMIGARFSSQDSSPSQTWSPTVSFQGNVIFTWGLITTPRPTEAPNHRSTAHLIPESFSGQSRNNPKLTNSQSNSLNLLAPRSYPRAENFDRSTRSSISGFQPFSVFGLLAPRLKSPVENVDKSTISSISACQHFTHIRISAFAPESFRS